MNKRNLFIIGGILFFLTISCSTMMQSGELAEEAVEKFHSRFNAEEFDQIYKQADDEFKKSVSQKEFRELLEALHRKLGKVEKADRTSWRVNTTPLGTFSTVDYDVQFSESKGTESFVFRIADERALLYNYNVNSPLLLTK